MNYHDSREHLQGFVGTSLDKILRVFSSTPVSWGLFDGKNVDVFFH